jgi:peptidylprolyl isomerase
MNEKGKKMKKIVFTMIAFCSFLFAQEQQEITTALISEGLGHIIGSHLDYLGIEVDTDLLVKGIEEARMGKKTPLSEKECLEAIHSMQSKAIKNLSEKNLNQAENFLAEQAKKPGIHSLAEGKIQYQILKKGEGAEVKPHASPLIRYTVKNLDGSIISAADQIETFSLNETISGLKIGMSGMKEGEKRILSIHPDLGYKEKGGELFAPNQLLIFEIEILKANT